MKAVRRIHLYLGMLLLPWFIGYGITSIMFSHSGLGERWYGEPVWTVRFERPYTPPNTTDLRELGAILMKEAGVTGSYAASRPQPDQINVYVHTFRTATQLIWDAKRGTLRAEDKQFRWDHFFTGWHARGGFANDGWSDLWAVFVDLVSLALIAWVVTGLVMWWQLKRLRAWGLVALGSGLVAFGALIALL
ncbi:MAG: hypothetical protein IPP90_09720 [Gemmatimonadaceae bacterium]|nr:hypothetical protein [Gemmatimonadaceae bacterium]